MYSFNGAWLFCFYFSLFTVDHFEHCYTQCLFVNQEKDGLNQLYIVQRYTHLFRLKFRHVTQGFLHSDTSVSSINLICESLQLMWMVAIGELNYKEATRISQQTNRSPGSNQRNRSMTNYNYMLSLYLVRSMWKLQFTLYPLQREKNCTCCHNHDHLNRLSIKLLTQSINLWITRIIKSNYF